MIWYYNLSDNQQKLFSTLVLCAPFHIGLWGFMIFKTVIPELITLMFPIYFLYLCNKNIKT